MCSVPLGPYTRGDALRDVVRARWIPAIDAFAPQTIFVSAEFDAHREDDMSHLLWTAISGLAQLVTRVEPQRLRRAFAMTDHNTTIVLAITLESLTAGRSGVLALRVRQR